MNTPKRPIKINILIAWCYFPRKSIKYDGRRKNNNNTKFKKKVRKKSRIERASETKLQKIQNWKNSDIYVWYLFLFLVQEKKGKWRWTVVAYQNNKLTMCQWFCIVSSSPYLMEDDNQCASVHNIMCMLLLLLIKSTHFYFVYFSVCT